MVERHSGYFIPIEGFDEMMYLMGQRFGYTDPCEHIESAAEQRVRDYQEQVKAFQEKLRAAETPSETQSAILRAMDAKQREELQRLDRRIELDEEDGEAYWERGKLYYFANDYAQALEDFTKAKELGMEDSKLYWYKGFCYRRWRNRAGNPGIQPIAGTKGDFGGVPQSGPVLYHCEAV